MAKASQERASQLHLAFSAYVAALVWNNQFPPVASLTALPNPRAVVRVRVPCSLRGVTGGLARKQARSSKLSVNAFLESLIAAELLSPDHDFKIRTGALKPKIQI